MKRALLIFVIVFVSSTADLTRADEPESAAAAPNSNCESTAPNGLTAESTSDCAAKAFGQASASQSGFFRCWLKRVAETQAEQPHWITPVVTVTPRLEQEFRYDMSQQTQPNGTTILRNFGGSKGLELIPTQHTELIFSPPPYITRSVNGVPDGYGNFKKQEA